MLDVYKGPHTLKEQLKAFQRQLFGAKNATSFDSNGTAEVTGTSADGNGNGGAGATSVDSVATPTVTAAGGTGGPVGATGSAGVNASVTGGVGQPGEPSSALSFFGAAAVVVVQASLSMTPIRRRQCPPPP